MMIYQYHDYATLYEIHFNRLKGESVLVLRSKQPCFEWPVKRSTWPGTVGGLKEIKASFLNH